MPASMATSRHLRSIQRCYQRLIELTVLASMLGIRR
jgi:hypothetical protein